MEIQVASGMLQHGYTWDIQPRSGKRKRSQENERHPNDNDQAYSPVVARHRLDLVLPDIVKKEDRRGNHDAGKTYHGNQGSNGRTPFICGKRPTRKT